MAIAISEDFSVPHVELWKPILVVGAGADVATSANRSLSTFPPGNEPVRLAVRCPELSDRAGIAVTGGLTDRAAGPVIGDLASLVA